MLSNNKMYLCSDESITYDTNYRYKIDAPLFEVKKKKGANITCFINSETFATAIEIDHLLLIKLIGSELSCQSIIDKDLKCGVFKGLFDVNQINSIICNIIQGYLLCQICDKPEVILYKKKHKLRQQCKACGEKNYIKTELEPTTMYEIISKVI
jgi:translation initiation factor 5